MADLDMSKPLDGWVCTKESPYARLDIPAGAGPVDLRFRITPGATEEGKQTVLLTAVNHLWDDDLVASRLWELWQLKVFAAHGKAVVEMDGRGPQQREVDPLKSRLFWDDRRGGQLAYDVQITYNASNGGFSIVRFGESLSEITWLRTDGPWSLLVGKPDSFDPKNLAAPLGWKFDLSWDMPGRVPPGSPPVVPEIDSAEKYYRQIEEALGKLRALRKGDA